MKKELCILGHFGLGDHLITNAIVRTKASEHTKVHVPIKISNLQTVRYMFRDLSNVETVPFYGDEPAKQWALKFERDDGDVLRLGMFGKDFDFKDWDQVMYRQAGMNIAEKWVSFSVPIKAEDCITPPKGKYAFVHDDPARGFSINRSLVGEPIITPQNLGNMFAWWQVINEATEIHCIDSSFANLVDLIPIEAQVLKLHHYARPKGNPPTWAKKWKILK